MIIMLKLPQLDIRIHMQFESNCHKQWHVSAIAKFLKLSCIYMVCADRIYHIYAMMHVFDIMTIMHAATAITIDIGLDRRLQSAAQGQVIC